ncbi:MAG: FAD-dependent oxidoreductase, partial [Rhodospirillales bacterium]|nr:FAD-dependent oxidoreductase [Rhodospirillales bacterium]
MIPPAPRIAVIGAGIAGLSAAWLLRHHADVTLFEAAPRAGGHADTELVPGPAGPVPVDCGFIVFNEHTYPNLTALFAALKVESIATTMSFAVSVDGGALEYGGGSLGQIFAQPANLARPRFLAMLRDIPRFYRQVPMVLEGEDRGESLGAYLARNRYGEGFIEDHILPMGAAIWSGTLAGMEAFPVRHFARFFANHGLLNLTRRPQWRSVAGGSRCYVAAMLGDLGARARLSHRVVEVIRRPGASGVDLRFADGDVAEFDQVILACHADQALALIGAPHGSERAILGAMRFQDNDAVLHADPALMPRRKRVWSAWNFLRDSSADRAG